MFVKIYQALLLACIGMSLVYAGDGSRLNDTYLEPTIVSVKDRDMDPTALTKTCDIWAIAVSLILFKLTGIASIYLMKKHRALHDVIATYEEKNQNAASEENDRLKEVRRGGYYAPVEDLNTSV